MQSESDNGWYCISLTRTIYFREYEWTTTTERTLFWLVIISHKLVHSIKCTKTFENLMDITVIRGLGQSREFFHVTSKARDKRRTSQEPNRILMREDKGFFSFAFDSAHVKYGVWPGPKTQLQLRIELLDTNYKIIYVFLSTRCAIRRFFLSVMQVTSFKYSPTIYLFSCCCFLLLQEN